MRHTSRQAVPPTKDAQLVSKHGVRAPRVKIVGRVSEDGWNDGAWIYSCGHTYLGGRYAVGQRVSCFACQIEKAKQIESNG